MSTALIIAFFVFYIAGSAVVHIILLTTRSTNDPLSSENHRIIVSLWGVFSLIAGLACIAYILLKSLSFIITKVSETKHSEKN